MVNTLLKEYVDEKLMREILLHRVRPIHLGVNKWFFIGKTMPFNEVTDIRSRFINKIGKDENITQLAVFLVQLNQVDLPKQYEDQVNDICKKALKEGKAAREDVLKLQQIVFTCKI